MILRVEIAVTLDQLADLLEFQGANAFRIRAYRNSARVIRDYPESIAAVVAKDPKSLTSKSLFAVKETG